MVVEVLNKSNWIWRQMKLKGIFRLMVSIPVPKQLSASPAEKRAQSEVTAQHHFSTPPRAFLSLTLQISFQAPLKKRSLRNAMWVPVTGNVLQASPAFKFLTAFSSDDESTCAVLPQFVVCYKGSWQFLDK